ncbi:MAG: DNA-directed RNA polymerase subunit alpha [Microgenomates group bacterium]
MISPNFYTQRLEQSTTYGRFILEPLPLSFGHSLGNSLRRTMLSSLKGAAITNVKIEGIPHFFTTIPGVKESVLEIILNLKKLKFQPKGDGPFKIYLSANKVGKIYGKNIEGEIKPVNSDIYIAEITDNKARLNIEAIVERGIGYSAVEDRENKISGFIPVDAFFSPVKKVNFKVEETRVGRKSDFERLILEIETDGSIKPEVALREAAELLSSYFNHILSGRDNFPEKKEEKIQETQVVDKKWSETIIDELNLPSRVINALLRENIETVADLLKVGEEKLSKMKGLGKKSIELIKEELKKIGIEFK